MQRFPVLAGLALMLSVPQAQALTPQQEKMKACNAEASGKSLKGDERKTFMQSCLSAQPAAAELTRQQQKMKTCNVDASAKHLKGADRKKFMSGCLSNAPAAAPAAPAQ